MAEREPPRGQPPSPEAPEGGAPQREPHGHWHQHRHRPPWWPEGEPYRRAASWGRPPPFLRRIAFIVAVAFGLTMLTNVVAAFVLTRGFHLGPRHRVVPLGAVLFVSLLVGLFATARAIRRVARPLADVMEAADRVASGDYGVRVEPAGPRDTRRLARSFNSMAERLAAGEEQRRNMLADVAHELRTPLSVIRGNVEAMLDGLYPADAAHLQPLLEETRIMSRLLEDLQTLSTAEAGVLRLHREAVAPGDLVEDAVAAFRPRGAEAGVRIDAVVAAELPELQVDRVRMGEVLSNLLTNALRHTPRSGSITVAAERDGQGVAFTVRDTGPGIAPDVLPHVFDRFVKAADSGGAGLGLAIARSLVVAHGGTITAENPAGGGTAIRFVLPREDQAGD